MPGRLLQYALWRGFCVDAIDLIPVAIEVAREQAGKRDLDVHFQVMDVVELPHHGKSYDIIVDSYCLQGIVTDSDRERLFAAIRARLKPQGYYLVSTAYFDEQQYCEDKIIRDEAGGKAYHYYADDQIMDATTDIVYRQLEANPEEWQDAVLIADRWYLPYRRHHKPDVIRGELTRAGFDILHQDVGNFVCCHSGAGVALGKALSVLNGAASGSHPLTGVSVNRCW